MDTAIDHTQQGCVTEHHAGCMGTGLNSGTTGWETEKERRNISHHEQSVLGNVSLTIVYIYI